MFACDPLIEYPSVIALGPRQGTLLVAHDYVTGLGIEIVRRDEIRLIQDSDGDGYADQSVVFAQGFNSIQGLASDGDAVYVMHAPLLTRLRDSDGDGVADERRDLIDGLGLPPEENSNRLHCANGVVAGHDGWLYLALGDRGCDVQRPEGDRLLFQEGGILRCRPDGHDLHVFCSGLRNIYDVALDHELNVFVRDNENDGGDYMIRVCHCFHGSDHGYPYHYYERPAEAMKPLADLGRGSSAGGVCYLETALPTEYRGNLFFCEWGRSVVRYRCDRLAASFAEMKELDFVAGDPADPYGLKPTDLVVGRDGSIFVSDWADGQRPKRGRGRIYRIEYAGGKRPPLPRSQPAQRDQVDQLNAPGQHARVAAQRSIERLGAEAAQVVLEALEQNRLQPLGRLHAIWILVHTDHPRTLDTLFALANADSDPAVSAQAVRAIADLSDPILAQHRLAAPRGDERIAARLSEIDVARDPRLLLEVIIALGRLRWTGAPSWLQHNLETLTDPAVEHASMQTIRRSGNWAGAFAICDGPNTPLRSVAVRALAGEPSAEVADKLIARLSVEEATRRLEYADLLSRIHRKKPPWKYWGFRPAPRQPNSVSWERTEQIENQLDGLLADKDLAVRSFVLKRMVRESIPFRIASLASWITQENDAARLSGILAALRGHRRPEVTNLLEQMVRSKTRDDANRLTALRMYVDRLDASSTDKLHRLGEQLEDGLVLASLLRELELHPEFPGDALLIRSLSSPDASVRGAAVAALAKRNNRHLGDRIDTLLEDPSIRVRRSAIEAAGRLKLRTASGRLLALLSEEDLEIQRLCLEALGRLEIAGAEAAAVAGLKHPETQLAALAYLEARGDGEQLDSVVKLAETSRSADLLRGAVRTLSTWATRQTDTNQRRVLLENVARIQGQSGALIRWIIAPIKPSLVRSPRAVDKGDGEVRLADGLECSVRLSAEKPNKTAWAAVSSVFLEEETQVEFLASSNGTLGIWLNGQSVFQREKPTAYRPNQDRFDAALPKGMCQIEIQVARAAKEPQFQLRFRPKSSKQEHERLISLLLTKQGNPSRGREVFLNENKSLCVKCHRIDKKGGQVGPDLSGIGGRFSRVHLIESILEPSRTVAPSYETITLALLDGRVLTGVKVAEESGSLTIGDNQGQKFKIARSDIDQIRVQTQSTMPDGLEKRLSDQELADLLGFLQSLVNRQ